MRLDWFTPVLRKPKADQPLRRRGLLIRVAQRVLPATLFSDPTTKRRGLIRRGLRWIGLSWLSSPVRRVCQGVCFALFLWLFLYVCWPYGARPPEVWRNGSPLINGETGEITLEFDDSVERIETGDVLFAVDDAPDAVLDQLGRFSVVAIQGKRVELEPSKEVSDEQLEAIFFSAGPLSLHQTDPERWPAHYADHLASKEKIAAELFLVIDPLVSLSTAVASRAWVWSLSCAGIILLVCVVIPRGFCGYLCPLGTLIDLFDRKADHPVQSFR